MGYRSLESLRRERAKMKLKEEVDEDFRKRNVERKKLKKELSSRNSSLLGNLGRRMVAAAKAPSKRKAPRYRYVRRRIR